MSGVPSSKERKAVHVCRKISMSALPVTLATIVPCTAALFTLGAHNSGRQNTHTLYSLS